MKHQFSNLAAALLIASSMMAGMIVAVAVSRPSNSLPADIGSDRDLPETSAAAEDEITALEAGQLIQDPPQRSSFRPDFSRGLRRSNQRSNFFMLRAFHEAVGDSWKSTVRLNVGGQQVAMGAIVGSEGWILSKASELPVSGEVMCRLHDGSLQAAQVVSRDDDLDLALLHIDRGNLPVVHWDASDVPERGRWLATTDVHAGVPSAVGVVSAGVQRIGRSNAVLGVHLDDTTQGAAVALVLPGSGATEAGLQLEDIITAVDGHEITSHRSFQAAVKDGIGGQVVKLSVKRAGRQFETEGRLMDLAEELLDETEMEVNGNVSARASGFGRVFMHDTVLEPNQCGGPLVNLDGKVVGINIARAGRVSSYALPADVVEPMVASLIERAKVVSHANAESRENLRPIR